MPRGKRKIDMDLNERIRYAKEQITMHEQEIKNWKLKLKELELSKKQEDLDKLYATMQSKGLSVGDVLALMAEEMEEDSEQ